MQGSCFLPGTLYQEIRHENRKDETDINVLNIRFWMFVITVGSRAHHCSVHRQWASKVSEYVLLRKLYFLHSLVLHSLIRHSIYPNSCYWSILLQPPANLP